MISMKALVPVMAMIAAMALGIGALSESLGAGAIDGFDVANMLGIAAVIALGILLLALGVALGIIVGNIVIKGMT